MLIIVYELLLLPHGLLTTFVLKIGVPLMLIFIYIYCFGLTLSKNDLVTYYIF